MHNKKYKIFDYEIVIALRKEKLEIVKNDKREILNCTFTYIGEIKFGKRGFHYYQYSALKKLPKRDFINQTVYEIEDTGKNTIEGRYSCCTDSIKIIKLLSREEKKALIENIK